MIIIENLPLSVIYGFDKKKNKPKKLILNLNTYRNTNSFILGVAKVEYAKLIKPLIEAIEPLTENNYHFHYKYYSKSNHLIDVANPLCIIDKFVCDTVVECGKLPNDNYKFIKIVSYEFGGVDKINPRADLYIKHTDNNYFQK